VACFILAAQRCTYPRLLVLPMLSQQNTHPGVAQAAYLMCVHASLVCSKQQHCIALHNITSHAPQASQLISSHPHLAPLAAVRQYPLPPLPLRNRLATSTKLYVFWNIDNKHPGGIDPRALCHHLRTSLAHYGSVQGVYGYAAKKTWNPVPPALLEQYGTRARRRLGPGVFR
jgi:hypothetical protein